MSSGERPSTLLAEIEAIAREAGAVLMEFFRRRIGFEYKGDVDLVTEADRVSEKLIVSRLRQRWPGYGIVAEEGSRADSDGGYRWYVDPLDGTTNFAHGFPVFCVSIALARAEEPVAGVVFDPTRDELFAAEKGNGTYLNGQRAHVSATKNLLEALLATGFPSHKRHQNPNIHFYHQLTLRSHGIRRAGSAALDLAYVAVGRCDAYWEFNLNPWDTLAGVLLVSEAGGTVTRMDGGPWRLDSQETLATNGVLHEQFLRAMDDIFHGRDLTSLPSVEEYFRSR